MVSNSNKPKIILYILDNLILEKNSNSFLVKTTVK